MFPMFNLQTSDQQLTTRRISHRIQQAQQVGQDSHLSRQSTLVNGPGAPHSEVIRQLFIDNSGRTPARPAILTEAMNERGTLLLSVSW